MSRKLCKTVIMKQSLTSDVASQYYRKLEKLPWQCGIGSRNGFTRLAYSVSLESALGEELVALISAILREISKVREIPNYAIFGIYINYYKDGNMYTPNHSHKGTHQLVISLGQTRTLSVGKKEFRLESGDSILFGSSIHGVSREENVRGGRISIATFMRPL